MIVADFNKLFFFLFRYIEVARQLLGIMSSIRPDIFLPPLLDKLTGSLETLTSPHKFTAAAKCLSSVARLKMNNQMSNKVV